MCILMEPLLKTFTESFYFDNLTLLKVEKRLRPLSHEIQKD